MSVPARPATMSALVRRLVQQIARWIAARRTPSDTWSLSLGPDMFLDFCVWVLERDGLRVPPFDRHPDGDGTLRAGGLTAEAWRAWFDRVVAAVAAFGAALPRTDADAWPPFPDPVALWEGSPAVAARLAELDAAYDAVSNERKDASAHFWWPGRHDEEGNRLWEVLAPYHGRLPPLSVVFVAYPGPARLVVPPATVVLAAAGWRPGPGGLTAAVLAGAAELAGDDRLNTP